MKRLYALIALAWAPLSSFGAPVRIVDQQLGTGGYFGYILDHPGDYIAQTFTVRNTGRLAEMGVQVSISGFPWDPDVTEDLVVRLLGVDATGIPTLDRVYGAHTFDKDEVPRDLPSDEYLVIDATVWNLQVRAGDVFAIAVSSDHAYYTHRGHEHYLWHGLVLVQREMEFSLRGVSGLKRCRGPRAANAWSGTG